jgi:hypothetical protein
MARSFLSQIAAKYGRLRAEIYFLGPWAIRHSACMHNRYQKHGNGPTSYELLKGVVYTSQVTVLGETVLYKSLLGTGRSKLEARWDKGIWLGRAELDDTHLGGY